jgi:hypothetical protein
MLDEAILVAGTRRESWSPVMLVLTRSEKRGKLVSAVYNSHRSQQEKKIYQRS